MTRPWWLKGRRRMQKTAKDYRAEGFTVAFRNTNVFLYRPDIGARFQPIDRGQWTQRPSGWVDAIDEEDWLIGVRAACFCGQTGGFIRTTCNFCSGFQPAPPIKAERLTDAQIIGQARGAG